LNGIIVGKRNFGECITKRYVWGKEDAPAVLDIDFLFEFAEIFDDTGTTTWLSGYTGVAAMKN